MPRAALFTLLIAATFCASLEAQRGGASFHGAAVRSGLQRGFSNQVSSRGGSLARGRRGLDSWGSYFLPYDDLPPDEPLSDQPRAAEAVANSPAPPFMIPGSTRQPAPREAQFIEIPGAANSPATKIPPPAVFILVDGERFEAQRFLLSASALSVTIDRKQRTVPLDKLDLEATISANHERGIDLRIPNDRNEISLSF